MVTGSFGIITMFLLTVMINLTPLIVIKLLIVTQSHIVQYIKQFNLQ